MLEAHRRMAGVIGQLDDERLLEPAMGAWTGKDIVAHMAWWHEHSVLVIESLLAGREPYDRSDPENSTDSINERTRREHLDDPSQMVRGMFGDSFARLIAAIERASEDAIFEADRWPWLSGEALVETILWDSSRHYGAHRENLERLSR